MTNEVIVSKGYISPYKQPWWEGGIRDTATSENLRLC